MCPLWCPVDNRNGHVILAKLGDQSLDLPGRRSDEIAAQHGDGIGPLGEAKRCDDTAEWSLAGEVIWLGLQLERLNLGNVPADDHD
jgi:hypothetical protein